MSLIVGIELQSTIKCLVFVGEGTSDFVRMDQLGTTRTGKLAQMALNQ